MKHGDITEKALRLMNDEDLAALGSALERERIANPRDYQTAASTTLVTKEIERRRTP